jgi:hypothetical protein
LQETLALNSPLDTSSRATPGDDAAGANAPAPRPVASALSASLNPRRVAELDEIFADNGLLARQIDGYRSRASQIEMSRAVAAAMEASGRAMPEPSRRRSGRHGVCRHRARTPPPRLRRAPNRAGSTAAKTR